MMYNYLAFAVDQMIEYSTYLPIVIDSFRTSQQASGIPKQEGSLAHSLSLKDTLAMFFFCILYSPPTVLASLNSCVPMSCDGGKPCNRLRVVLCRASGKCHK